MDEQQYRRGLTEAESDIAAGECRLFWQARGSWGELLTTVMRDRFDVQVVHTSDICTEGQRSYWYGYNSTVKAYLDGRFGAGAYKQTLDDVERHRQEVYRRWLESQKDGECS